MPKTIILKELEELIIILHGLFMLTSKVINYLNIA